MGKQLAREGRQSDPSLLTPSLLPPSLLFTCLHHHLSLLPAPHWHLPLLPPAPQLPCATLQGAFMLGPVLPCTCASGPVPLCWVLHHPVSCATSCFCAGSCATMGSIQLHAFALDPSLPYALPNGFLLPLLTAGTLFSLDSKMRLCFPHFEWGNKPHLGIE